LMSAPRGLGSMVAMLVTARVSNRVDPRLMIVIGASLTATSLWFMTAFNLQMDTRPGIVANFIQGLGTGRAWIPLTVMAFATISYQLRTSGAAITALARSLGGSV